MQNGLLISCFLVIMTLLVLRYRARQKNNRFLQVHQKLLAEKEWLLKEIHHRVKNNLQIVISLLNAQSDFLDNPSALHAIRESRQRMQAIALIHQKLYQPDNSTLIDMRSYIKEMVAYLENGFTDNEKINFKLSIDDSKLDVSQAVPLGLILNEAITNAIQHAFPSDRRGLITIELQHPGFPPQEPRVPPVIPPPESPDIPPGDPPDILLEITDDGQGLPAGFDLSGSNSLGIQLMKLFAEQLEGEIHFHSGQGVKITLLFKQQLATGFLPAFLY